MRLVVFPGKLMIREWYRMCLCTSRYILVLVLKSVKMLCSECDQEFSGGEPCWRRQTSSTLQSKSPDEDLTRSLAQMVPLTASRPSGRNERCTGACERVR
jgi:hypothetical protein